MSLITAASKPDNEPVPDWFVENLFKRLFKSEIFIEPTFGTKRRNRL